MEYITERQAKRFKERCIETASGCMEWEGAKTYGGYGIVRVGSKCDGTYTTKLAHRVAYYLENGHIPDGLIICHKCDNPSCTNPDHLYAGTYKDNVGDMDSRGRRVIAPLAGEKNPTSKLSQEQVDAIRSSGMSMRALAEKHGVSKTQICRIKKGLAWRSSI